MDIINNLFAAGGAINKLIHSARRYFFTADGTATTGDFPEVTLKGDFVIRFKAVSSGAAGSRRILGQAAAPGNWMGFNTTNLNINLVGLGAHVFGAVAIDKLISVEISRAGATVTATVDGAALGSAYIAPGDVTLDASFFGNSASFHDNAIADLEIIDLDQPASRDVLTFGGVDELGVMPSITLAVDFDYEITLASSVAGEQLSGQVSGTNQRLYAGLDGTGSKAQFGCGDQFLKDTGAAINDGAVHTLKIELRGTTATCYVDGASIGTLTTVVFGTRTFDDFSVGALSGSSSFFKGPILDVKLHDLDTPANSRRYRMDVESNTTVPDDYGSADALTLNNVVSSDWETMTRDTSTGDWVGPATTLTDATYSAPVDILWKLDSGSTVSETSFKAGAEVLTLNNVVAGDWERLTRVGGDWYNAAGTKVLDTV